MKQRKNLLVILALALATAACDSNGPEPPQTETITFGSDLESDHQPNDAVCQRPFLTPPCTIVGADLGNLENPPEFVDPWAAPVDGVITKIRIRAASWNEDGEPTDVTFRLVEIDLADPDTHDECSDCVADAVAVMTGPTVELPPAPEDPDEDIPIIEIDANLPVQEGQHLAIDATDAAAIYDDGGATTWTWVYDPPLVDGAAPQRDTSVGTPMELLVQADIEYEVE